MNLSGLCELHVATYSIYLLSGSFGSMWVCHIWHFVCSSLAKFSKEYLLMTTLGMYSSVSHIEICQQSTHTLACPHVGYFSAFLFIVWRKSVVTVMILVVVINVLLINFVLFQRYPDKNFGWCVKWSPYPYSSRDNLQCYWFLFNGDYHSNSYNLCKKAAQGIAEGRRATAAISICTLCF